MRITVSYDVLECLEYKASKTGFKMYVFIKTVRQNGKTYRYLVIEEYDPRTKRKKVLLHLSLRKILEHFKNEVDDKATALWCGGWDSNPRRPTPTGLKPAPFDRARAPPHPLKTTPIEENSY